MRSIAAADRFRILAAFAVLPIVLGLVAYQGAPLVLGLSGRTSFADAGRATQLAAVTALLTVLLSAVALPLVFAAIRTGRTSWQRLLLMGAALGNAPFAFYVVALVLPATAMHFVQGTLDHRLAPMTELLAGVANAVIIGTTFGLIGAAVVWVIAVRRLEKSD